MRAPACRCCRWSRGAETRRQILLYTFVLAPLGAAPWLLGYAGPVYGVVAVATGALLVGLAWRVRAEREGHRRRSKQLFGFSILYLFLLFAALLAEHGWEACSAISRHECVERSDE